MKIKKELGSHRSEWIINVQIPQLKEEYEKQSGTFDFTNANRQAYQIAKDFKEKGLAAYMTVYRYESRPVYSVIEKPAKVQRSANKSAGEKT